MPLSPINYFSNGNLLAGKVESRMMPLCYARPPVTRRAKPSVEIDLVVGSLDGPHGARPLRILAPIGIKEDFRLDGQALGVGAPRAPEVAALKVQHPTLARPVKTVAPARGENPHLQSPKGLDSRTGWQLINFNG
jgi:hypothetical protein